jgi:hypothetical protein
MIFVHRGTFVLLRDFNGMTGREDMFTRCVGRIGVLAGFCSTALLIGLATSAYRTSLSREPQEFFSATIERTLKGDRLTHSTNIAGPSNSIAVDLFGTSDVVVRDPDGNIMFAVNHSARTTTVGKQPSRRVTFPARPAAAEKELPDGCEGAFSPYVEPDKAHIIGRCVSGISPALSDRKIFDRVGDREQRGGRSLRPA